MNKENKKTILIAIGVLVVVVLLGVWAEAPRARANAFTDFLGRILAPFAPYRVSTSTLNLSSSSPSLYQPVNDYENAVVSAVQKASPAVVSITISENVPVIENCQVNPFSNLPSDLQQLFGGDVGGFTAPCTTGKTQLQEVGGGSGFIISSDGLILTNKHVVSDAGASYTVLTNDGKTYDAKVLARDPSQDLAVIKIDATGLPTVTLGDSSGVELGQTAIAIGNALGQFSNTVSVGVISGLSRNVTATAPDTGAAETIEGVIQTDAAINPGNSGGPLLNLRGEVIGIDTAVASQAQNVGFALPINRAKADINSVLATGSIKVPYLGVRYLDVTPAIAKSQKLSVDYGALVKGDSSGAAVMPNSPAAKAGIQAGDVILSINGQKLDNTHDLSVVIDGHTIGDTLTIVVERDGKEVTLQATLTERPAGQ